MHYDKQWPNFKNTSFFATGISDFHKMILTIFKTSFLRSSAKKWST